MTISILIITQSMIKYFMQRFKLSHDESGHKPWKNCLKAAVKLNSKQLRRTLTKQKSSSWHPFMFSPQRTLHGLCFHCVDNTQNDFHTIYHIQWTFRRWHVSFSPAYRFNRLLMSVFHRLRSTQNLDLWTGFKTNEMHNYMRHVQTLIWKQIAQIIHAQFTLIIRFRWGFELWWALQWWILWNK